MIRLIVLTWGLLGGPDVPPLSLLPARPIDRVVAVIDGDTVCLDVLDDLYFRGGRPYRRLHTEDVRIDGYDAPEAREPGGPEATAALEELLGSDGRIWIHWRGKQSFGRLICEVYLERLDGTVIDVAAVMRVQGHHLPRSER